MTICDKMNFKLKSLLGSSRAFSTTAADKRLERTNAHETDSQWKLNRKRWNSRMFYHSAKHTRWPQDKITATRCRKYFRVIRIAFDEVGMGNKSNKEMKSRLLLRCIIWAKKTKRRRRGESLLNQDREGNVIKMLKTKREFLMNERTGKAADERWWRCSIRISKNSENDSRSK